MASDGESSSVVVSSIFPKNNSVLLCAPSRSGKTSFIHKLLINKNLYFGDNHFDSVIIVSCNPKVDIVLPELESCSVKGIYLEEFDSNLVEEGTCIIFDDVSTYSSKIGEALNVLLHHLNLPFIAVLVHSVLGTDLFKFASICHKIIFFLGSTSSARLAAYIISRFFRDKETKLYLEQVLAFCQTQNNNLLICLNKGANERLQYLALSHLDSLSKFGYCLAYQGSSHQIPNERMEVDDRVAKNFDLTNLPPNTCVLVPVTSVLKAKQNLSDSSSSSSSSQHLCTKIWNQGVADVERAIETYFKVTHWSRCKNILREILKNSSFCLDPDSLILYLKKFPKQKANLIDFLAFSIRPCAPGENCKPDHTIFKRFAATLLSQGSPKNLFKNKFLL